MNVPVSEQAVKALDALHMQFGKRDIQTIRGGTQVGLDGCPDESVKEMLAALTKAIGSDINEVWSIRMQKGGQHVQHNHPNGRLSGVYYLRVGKGADLVLGGRTITPEEGMVITFPSWMEHGTTVYEGEEPRLTVAFDIR